MPNRQRALESEGGSTLYGEYKLACMSGLVTVAAAATSTAGHMFVMRNPTASAKKMNLRYLKASFATTTAMTNQQPMGYDLFVGRTCTVNHSGGTAVDMGSTITTTNKIRAGQPVSMFTAGCVRIATTAGMTVGTLTAPDANPISQGMFLSPVLGAVESVVLYDARIDGVNTASSPLTIAPDEILIVRNVVLMGAVGVGYLTINAEWDEFLA